MPHRAMAWFCDDVREERGSKETIVGLYSDSIAVPRFPGAFKKVIVVIHIHADLNEPLTEIKLFLRSPNAEEEEIADFDLSDFEQGRQHALERRMPFLLVVAQVTVEPLKVEIEGVIEAVLRINGERMTVGALLVRQIKRPLQSPPPSSDNPG